MARGLWPPHPGFKHLTFRPRGRHPCYVPPPIMVQQRRLRSTLRSDPKCLCKIRCRPCRLLSAWRRHVPRSGRSRGSCGTGQRPHYSTALASRRSSIGASKWTHSIYAAHAGQTCKNSDRSPFWAHLRALHRTDRRQRAPLSLCRGHGLNVLVQIGDQAHGHWAPGSPAPQQPLTPRLERAAKEPGEWPARTAAPRRRGAGGQRRAVSVPVSWRRSRCLAW